MTSSDQVEEARRLFKELVDTHPEIELKGKNMLYTSVNGHMFSILNKQDFQIGIRLPKEEREAFIEKFNTQIHQSYGSNMPEYARIPFDLLKDTQTLVPYLKVSYDYVRGLEPKPTKKK